MKKSPFYLPTLLAVGLGVVSFVGFSNAQTTGFNQTGAGPFFYTDTANWVNGTVNGIWSTSLTVTTGQIVEFTGNTTLLTGLTFRENDSQAKTLRANGGASTLTLGGDILMNPNGNATYTIGSTSGGSNLNVDLDGAIRTFTVFGGGNGGNFGKTLNFLNNVSNGGVIASGGGSGGGKIQFSGLSVSLDSSEVRDAELSFNGSGNSSANSLYTISGTMTAGGGASTVTVHPKTSATTRNATLQAGAFERKAGGTILFRGGALGTTTIASFAGGVSNIAFTDAPTLLGGMGVSGTSTISIIAGAFGDTSTTGSGFGATGGLVTYDTGNGVRLLSVSEYKNAITDLQTQLDNVRIANSSGVISTTTLTSGTTTINSLSLDVTGATGNQGITVAGDPGAVLKLNSGVIYAYQNVTGGSSPATTAAMTINVPTLDLNGQEGIILVNTRLNSGGTVVSNGGLFIDSTITNGTGLTIGDGVATNAGGYVVLGGSGSNSYTGNTTVNGAIVRLGKSVSNTFGNVVLNLGSIYDAGNQIVDTANLTIHGGTFYLNGSNNSGSATNETIADLTMTGGGINPGSGSGNTFNVNGNASLSGGAVDMAKNAKLNVGGTTSLTGGRILVGSNESSSVYNSKTTLTGPVNITNTAEGTSAYTPITISAGAAAGNLGGQVEFSGDLTFTGNANTNTVTIAAPTGAGQQGVLALNGTRTFDIGNGAAAIDLAVQAGVINGTATGGLTKTGLGVLALNGVNTYTGPTSVNAGTLLVNGSLSAVGNVTVTAGTLGGAGNGTTTGVVGGSTALSAGAKLSPGTEAGLVGNLTFSNGLDLSASSNDTAGYLFNLGSVALSDKISLTSGVANALNVGTLDAADFTFTTGVGFGAGTYVLFDASSVIAGSIGTSFVDFGSGITGTLSIDSLNNDVLLTVVPEPSTWLLLTGGLMAVTFLRRRQRA